MSSRARALLGAVTAGLVVGPASLAAVRARAPGVVVSGEAFDRGGRAVAGGLVDPALFGEAGDRFARLVLAEPVPHPLFDGVVLHEVPVLPPAHRPTRGSPQMRSSLELAYAAVLRRGHRLAAALELAVPGPLLEQERRQLAGAVEHLFVDAAGPASGREEASAALLDLAALAGPSRLREILFALAVEVS